MTQISYIAENVALPQLNHEAVASWVEKVAALLGKRVGALSYIFCDDEYILDTNRKYLQHDYYTDIITFDYSNRRRISGDMVISLDTVRTNAEQFAKSCGINDKGPGEREIMEQHENEALAIVPSNIFES